MKKDTNNTQIFGRQVLFTPTWANPDSQSIAIVAEVYFLFLVSAFLVFGGLKGIHDRLNFKFYSGMYHRFFFL